MTSRSGERNSLNRDRGRGRGRGRGDGGKPNGRMSSCWVPKERSANTESTPQDCASQNSVVDSSPQPKNSLEDSVNSKERGCQSVSRLDSSQAPQALHSQHQSHSPDLASADSQHQSYSTGLPSASQPNTYNINRDIPFPTEKNHHEKIPSEKSADHLRKEHSELVSVAEPFDILQSKKGTPLALKPSLFATNKAKRNEQECSRISEKHILRQGMVLLKKYISQSDQINIWKKCRELGCGPGGFYQPGYRDGAKLHLRMMCLGKNWDPETREYGDRRSTDDACPPSIPTEFKQLVECAIRDSQDFIKKESKVSDVEEVLPGISPDICIVNFYTENGKLGLHQDRDESRESLRRGLPVVSLSIGDSAEFLYGDNREIEKADSVVLDSGDVLIFGGNARHVYHGVSSIKRNSAPAFLAEEANTRPGRLNLTFRKF